MQKVTIFSAEFWKYILESMKQLVKIYPFQVAFSFIFMILMDVIAYMGQEKGLVSYFIFASICYIIGTNVLLYTVFEKIEYGWAQNSVVLHILLGTGSNRIKFSYWYFIPKFIVAFLKFTLSPLLLIIALLQYQSLLNKALAEEKISRL